MADEEEDKGPKSIVYFGKDEKYFEQYCRSLDGILRTKLQRYIIEYEGVEPSKLVLEVVDKKPDLIILDFSKDRQTLVKVSFFLSRMYPLMKIPFIGFLTALKENTDLIDQMVYSGVNFLLYKLPEIEFSSVPTALMFNPDNSKFPDFYVKETKDIAAIFIPMRVGYINQEKIHVESSADILTEDLLKIKTSIFNVPVYFKKINRGVSNLYYHFPFNYDFDFHAPSEIKLMELTEENQNVAYLYEAEIEEQMKKIVENLESVMEKTVDNDKSRPKKLRVLLIDHELRTLHEGKEQIDEFSFSIRLHQYLDPRARLVEEVLPKIIFYFLKDPHIGKREIPAMVSKIQEIGEGFDPVIIVFDEQDAYIKMQNDQKQKLIEEGQDAESIIVANRYECSEAGYSKLITTKAKFTFDTLVTMIDRYKEKLLEGTADENFTVYFSKKDKESFAYMEDQWRIKKISEPFLIFESETRLPLYSLVKAKLGDVIMVLTIAPFPSSYESIRESKSEQFAIINGIDEMQQAKLRLHIHKPEKEDVKEKNK
ncbi:MAG: hypothetical protein H6621_00790 [Halobacteriovoraceae bacterium]|nr:hypothetical protein [Halobacteriovoraceae bacterium]MCB9093577.1 hypothetical protein [Halobacteriovoraceae bacterium]